MTDAPRDARRERPASTRDAKPGAAHPAVVQKRRDDAPGGGADRDGESKADAGDRGIDADDLSGRICKRATRVAGVERRIGLDHVLDHARS